MLSRIFISAQGTIFDLYIKFFNILIDLLTLDKIRIMMRVICHWLWITFLSIQNWGLIMSIALNQRWGQILNRFGIHILDCNNINRRAVIETFIRISKNKTFPPNIFFLFFSLRDGWSCVWLYSIDWVQSIKSGSSIHLLNLDQNEEGVIKWTALILYIEAHTRMVNRNNEFWRKWTDPMWDTHMITVRKSINNKIVVALSLRSSESEQQFHEIFQFSFFFILFQGFLFFSPRYFFFLYLHPKRTVRCPIGIEHHCNKIDQIKQPNFFLVG